MEGGGGGERGESHSLSKRKYSSGVDDAYLTIQSWIRMRDLPISHRDKIAAVTVDVGELTTTSILFTSFYTFLNILNKYWKIFDYKECIETTIVFGCLSCEIEPVCQLFSCIISKMTNTFLIC